MCRVRNLCQEVIMGTSQTKSTESNADLEIRHSNRDEPPSAHVPVARTFWAGLTGPSALSLGLALLVAGAILLLRALGVDLGIGRGEK